MIKRTKSPNIGQKIGKYYIKGIKKHGCGLTTVNLASAWHIRLFYLLKKLFLR